MIQKASQDDPSYLMAESKRLVKCIVSSCSSFYPTRKHGQKEKE